MTNIKTWLVFPGVEWMNVRHPVCSTTRPPPIIGDTLEVGGWLEPSAVVGNEREVRHDYFTDEKKNVNRFCHQMLLKGSTYLTFQMSLPHPSVLLHSAGVD